MACGPNWGTAEIVRNFSRWERFKALRSFYREYSFGGKSFHAEFMEEMRATLKAGKFR